MQNWRGSLLVGCVALVGTLGLAQEPPFQLEDEVITAEKREGTAQTAALSVTTISGESLEKAGYDEMLDVSRLVPNMFVSQFNVSRLTFPTIRGIGSGQGNPAVVTYIDDVPQLTFNTVGMPLLDLERVEVLRGPQGTLYGRNALGGVIRAVSRDPGPEFRGFGRFGAGSDDRVEGQLSLSGPFENQENLYWGLTLAGHEHDGFVRNTMTGNNLDQNDSAYGRLKLHWTPSDDWDATLTVVREKSTDGSFVLNRLSAVRQNPYQAAFDYEGGAEREVFGPSLRLRRHGDSMTFTSVTSWQSSSITESTDIDFLPADFNRRYVNEDQDQFFQEFRLASNEGEEIELSDNLGLSWLIGAAAWHSRVDNFSQLEVRQGYVDYVTFLNSDGDPNNDLTPLPGPLETNDFIDQTDKGIALYGEGSLLLGDHWELTLGSRFAYEEKEADIVNSTTSGGFEFPGTQRKSPDESYTEWLPKVALAYYPTAEWTLYTHVERGFKSGGFNAQAPAGNDAYDTETSWAWEAGAKWQSENGRWRVRAAAFLIDWEDMQLTQPLGGGLFYVDNVGEAESRGFEIEASGQLTKSLRAYASVGVTDAEFDTYNDPNAGDVSGNEINNVPAHTWLVGLECTAERGAYEFFARADVTGRGEMWYDAGNTQKQGDWTIVNFRAGVQRGNIGLEAWIRNAFDEEYVPIALELQPGYFVGQAGAPQEVGAALTIRF